MPTLTISVSTKRFIIDDVLGIWIIHDPATDAATWQQFQGSMNTPEFELQRELTPRSHRTDFMDLTLALCNGRIETTFLYEKPLNLHLYIPPHSCHPAGFLQGMVFGNLFRIFTLCTNVADRWLKTKQILGQLIAQGYSFHKLQPLFNQGITRAKVYQGPQPKTTDFDDSLLLLHVQYHPGDPSSRELQRIYRNTFTHPLPRQRPISDVPTCNGPPVGIERMIVAYSGAPNLGNILSYRRIHTGTSPPVSSSYC